MPRKEKTEPGQDPVTTEKGIARSKERATIKIAGQRPFDDAGPVSSLFDQMKNGFVYGKLVMDEDGSPIDLEYLDMNPAYERLLARLKGQMS